MTKSILPSTISIEYSNNGDGVRVDAFAGSRDIAAHRARRDEPDHIDALNNMEVLLVAVFGPGDALEIPGHIYGRVVRRRWEIDHRNEPVIKEILGC